MMREAKDNDSLVRLEDVSVFFRRRVTRFRSEKYPALKNINLNLFHGESLGVIGRNGAGKTTLLRLLARIIGPDSGKVHYADGCTASLLSLQVGFLPYLTGSENSILSGMLLGMRRRRR